MKGVEPTPVNHTQPGKCGSDSPADYWNQAHELEPVRLLNFVAAILCVFIVVLASAWGGAGVLWGKRALKGMAQDDVASQSSPQDANLSAVEIDRQEPQKQAEILLERAVAHASDAPLQIESRVESWRGKLRWDAQLGQLSNAALNSRDGSVRDSAVEVQLAAYGLSKTSPTVDTLIRQVDSSDHARAVWALWGLGLLANRGIEADRAVNALTAHLKNFDPASSAVVRSEAANEDTRRWAVEALALAGTPATITPLLDALHDDPSALVRERAAGSLTRAGMFDHFQQMLAVPRLIGFADDPALDERTHALAFQALEGITRQRLPNRSAAWREWYERTGINE